MQVRGRRAVAIGVLALHLALLWLAVPRRPAPPPAPPPAAPLTVHLLARPVPDHAPPAHRPPTRHARLPLPPLPALPTVDWRPEAITLPVDAAGAAGRTASPAPAEPAAAASAAKAAPPALDLRLPAPALRGADPARPPPPPRPRSVESRLAQALGVAPLREEALGDGRLRLRQGTRCVELRPTRQARLDPFNESVSPTPRQAEDCRR